jgi:hypothetical protein
LIYIILKKEKNKKNKMSTIIIINATVKDLISESYISSNIEKILNTDKNVETEYITPEILNNIKYEDDLIKQIPIKLKHERCLFKCWWCSRRIEHHCIGLPYKLENKTFFTKGHFCSFNCAYTWNVKLNVDDIVKCDNLLINLFNSSGLHGKLELALGRESMSDYGGQLTKEEYGKLLHNNQLKKMNVSIIYPPMISTQQFLDFDICQLDKNKQKKMIIDGLILDIEDFSNTDEEYRVYRKTPLLRK